jgi:hypothetical protein
MEIQEIPRKRVRKEVRKKPGNCLDVALLAKHQEAITSPEEIYAARKCQKSNARASSGPSASALTGPDRTRDAIPRSRLEHGQPLRYAGRLRDE